MADSRGGGRLRLQPLARARVDGLGAPGREWLEALPALLDDLEQRWHLRIERRSLPGGSNGVVLAATTADGGARVVKLAAPDVDLDRQARVLRAAGGRGHVRLHAHDPGRQAVLLDRLGRSLARTPGPVEDALDATSATLLEAWSAVPPTSAAQPAEASRAHARRVVDRLDVLVDRAGPAAEHLLGHARSLGALVAAARACGDRRAADPHPGPDVVCHGDAHPANLLRAPGAPTGWLLVDPEGPSAPASYDVGVALRDWSSHLQDPATAAPRLRRWCARAAAATGTDPAAVEEWAFLERVVTGLHLLDLGAPRVARPLLTSAGALTAPGAVPVRTGGSGSRPGRSRGRRPGRAG